MENEADLIEALQVIGYKGQLLKNDILEEAMKSGPKSENFRELVTWIAFEIHVLRKTDEKIEKGTDFNEFMLELSGLLKELGCPYKKLVAGPISDRFQTKQLRLLLLDYLITELMASKMCLQLKPEENSLVIPVFESSTARALQSITKDLNLGKPPENIKPKTLFDKISQRLDEFIKKANPKKLSTPLFNPTRPISDKQWETLEIIHKTFDDEYNLRRQMLLTRLDVTIQSFQWSEKMKGRESEITNIYDKKKSQLDSYKFGGSDTNIAALLGARSDLAIIEKTSNASVRKNTASKIQKHVIGRVPDRGGRAYEHAPPPPEMPSWQQNRSVAPAGRGGGSGGRGGSGRGGRGGGAQGGWSQGQQSNSGYNQRPEFDQKQQFNQRQQQYDNRQGDQRQFDNRDNQRSSGGGNTRVQGGWSQRGYETKGGYNQRGNDDQHYGNDNASRGNYGGNVGGNFSGHYQNQEFSGNSNYGGNNRSNSYRGKSKYNRGGGNRL